jgi:hypothetical protein
LEITRVSCEELGIMMSRDDMRWEGGAGDKEREKSSFSLGGKRTG